MCLKLPTQRDSRLAMSRRLLQATSKVSGMTLLSRLLGFARDMVFARLFGSVAGFDAFLLAFKLPNFMRALFAEGAFSQAFVPVLVQSQSQDSPERVSAFLNRTLGALWCCVILLSLVAVAAAPALIALFAPGFRQDPERFHLATQLLRVTFPYLVCITTAAFFAAILNSLRRFMLPAFVPCMLNVALIWAAMAWTHFEPRVAALAWGVILGGVLQALVQVPTLWRLKVLPRPAWFWRDPGVRRVVKLMVPALFGVSVVQVGLLVSTVFASYLAVGSLSWLYYAERLIYLPVGVFGVAMATVVLPSLSRAHAQASEAAYRRCLDWGWRMVLTLAIPAAVGMACLATPLLVTLFHYGAFGIHDVQMTRLRLLAYCVGLPAFMLIKVLAAAFYAKQAIKTPVKVAVVAVCLNVLFNALLIGPMAHAGLALASSLSAWCNALALWCLAKKRAWLVLGGAVWRWVWQCAAAVLLMLVVLWWVVPEASRWQAWHGWQRTGALLALLCLGVGVYTMVLALCGWRLKDLNPEAP